MVCTDRGEIATCLCRGVWSFMVMVDGNLGSYVLHMAVVMVGDVLVEGTNGFRLHSCTSSGGSNACF